MAAGAAVLALAAPALAAPAELDDTFGTRGVTFLALHEEGGFTFLVSDVAVTADGSTLLLGGILRIDGTDVVAPGADFDLAVARLDPTGRRLDASFGTDGVARMDAGGFDLPARLDLDDAGRVVFGANRVEDDGSTTAIVGRLTSAGELDETFGVGGLATVSTRAAQFSNDLVVDDTGRPVVALVAGDDPERAETADAAVTRLTTAGQPDITFGTAGTATVVAGGSGAFGITGDGSGGYLVTGLSDDVPFVARIDSTGAPVAAFGDRGTTRLPVEGGIGMVVERAADGTILVGGPVGTRTGLLARLDGAGKPATSFGRGGVRTVRADDGGPMPVTAIAAGDGGTITFVAPQQGATARATVGRLLASGAEDAAFGGDGYVHPLDGSGRVASAGTALAADAQGKLVVAGITSTAAELDAFAARLDAVSPGAAVTTGTVRRVAGADRVGTAVQLSRVAFTAAGTASARTANEVVLAASAGFPDALVAAPYAAAVDAPLLLNPPTRLDPRVLEEIQRVLPAGGRVTLMGGVGAIRRTVADELRSAGFSVGRIAGADRYETSVRVAEALAPAAAFLARGDAFPDALAAGPAAAEINGVVLLTAGDRLPAVVRDHLAGQPELARYAVGGQAASADPDAEAVAGPTRYATAALVAERFFHTPSRTVVASGQRFPDALAGGAYASLTGSPLLLTMRGSLPEPTRQLLLATRPFHRFVTVAGGTAIIDGEVLEAVRRATS